MKLDFRHGVVEMAHGSGGRAMSELVEQLFLAAFDNEWLRQRNDQARFAVPAGNLVMATDSHVVSPLFFPGGDIGSLSVHGTINDIAMSGAQPLYLAAGFVIEEGFPLYDLQLVVQSMADASKAAQVPIVTGDTKVVERGNADGLYITTTGVGVVPGALALGPENIQPGDKILLSGTLGDHGMTIMSQREHLQFESNLVSDSQALHRLVAALVSAVPQIACMRDPTRGGLAATLNELAQQARVGMQIQESAIPVKPAVAATAELLGLDPLYIANEGKLVAICPADKADRLLEVMRQHPQGTESAIIGDVVATEQVCVQLKTRFGGVRLVDWRYGDPLPRIC